jgi:hypothetical protein
MPNRPPDIANDKRNNNCPVTVNYVNFSFCWQADKKCYKIKLLICINKCIYLKKVDTK